MISKTVKFRPMARNVDRDSANVTSAAQIVLQGGPRNGLFLKVDNFATVGGRNAYYMSKFSKFYLENEYITGMSVR